MDTVLPSCCYFFKRFHNLATCFNEMTCCSVWYLSEFETFVLSLTPIGICVRASSRVFAPV